MTCLSSLLQISSAQSDFFYSFHDQAQEITDSIPFEQTLKVLKRRIFDLGFGTFRTDTTH